jgi:hypothetical protein
MKLKSFIILLLVCVIASCAPANTYTSAAPTDSTTPVPTVPATPTAIPIDPFTGNWTGTFKGITDGFAADIIVFIDANCEQGKVCGTYSAPSLPCSGNLTLDRIENSTFVFVEEWTDGADWCGSGGLEHMELLPDHTLSWGFSNPGESIKSRAILTKLVDPTGRNWDAKTSLLVEAPFVFQAHQEFWDQGEIPDSGIVFSASTRWNFNIEVDGTSKDATGISFRGYAANGDEQILGLYYHSGAWHLGYSPVDKYIYWWDFNELTSPKQNFTLSVFSDGKKMSIQNDEGFSQDIIYQPKIFDGAEYVTVGFLSSPKVNLSLSNLVVEQLQDPSAPALATLNLKASYTTSFEELDGADPVDVSPFRLPTFLEMVLFYVKDRHSNMISKDVKFTSWAADARAHTGKVSINVIPEGNPPTKSILPLTIATLDPVFDTTGYDTITLRMWVNTTSNPRKASVHNCDSSLNIFYKTGLSESWKHYSALCGENMKESQGWHEISLDFDVKGKTTIQFAFLYNVQNTPQPDPTVYYLIDDIEVTAK